MPDRDRGLFSQLLWREWVWKTNGGARDGTTQQAGSKNVMKWHPKKGSFLAVFRGSKKGSKNGLFWGPRATRSRCVEALKFVVHEQTLWCKHTKRDELQQRRQKRQNSRFLGVKGGIRGDSGPGQTSKIDVFWRSKRWQQHVEQRSTSSLKQQKSLFWP